jgi:hypothetical protein
VVGVAVTGDALTAGAAVVAVGGTGVAGSAVVVAVLAGAAGVAAAGAGVAGGAVRVNAPWSFVPEVAPCNTIIQAPD